MATNTGSPVGNLRPTTRIITTTREDGKAVIHSSEESKWQDFGGVVVMSLLYTTSEFPTDMNNDKDVKEHEELDRRGIGLVNPGGTVCRLVDFWPANEPLMHRTQSLDYGVVLEGEVDMLLDSGDCVRMRRGDVAVQRGTVHGWKNASDTEWARMMFVLLDSKPLTIGGEESGEMLPEGMDEMASRR